MPIVFAPPQAESRHSSSSSNVSAMYAAEIAAKQRAGEAQGDLMLRNMQFNQGQELQAAMFAAGRQYSHRDAGIAQAEMNQQAQRFQLQADLNATELSQAEAVRLQRLKQAEAGVKMQLDQNAITPDEATQMLTQLRTSINPYEQRKAATEQKRLEQGVKMADFQYDRQVERDQKAKDLESKNFEQRFGFFVDPTTREQLGAELAQQDPTFGQKPPEVQNALVTKAAVKLGLATQGFQKSPGQWEIHPVKPAAGTGQGKEVKPADQPHPEYNSTVGEYQKALTAAEKQARDELQMTVGDGVDKKRVHPVPEAEVEKWMYGKDGQPGRVQQHLERRLGKRPQGGQQGDRQGNAEPPAAWKPFDASRPETASEGQQEVLGRFAKLKNSIVNRPDLKDDVRATAALQIDEAAKLIAKHGSVQAMQAKSKPDYEKYVAAERFIKQLASAPAPLKIGGSIPTAGGTIGTAPGNGQPDIQGAATGY